jgi:hypothetical protein
VRVPVHVLNVMVDDFMLKLGSKAVIGIQLIGEDSRTSLNVLSDAFLEFWLPAP